MRDAGLRGTAIVTRALVAATDALSGLAAWAQHGLTARAVFLGQGQAAVSGSSTEPNLDTCEV
ncbi:MAG: hypothetical protein ACLPVY_18565 [Acidimicrobiia bacterium]